MAKPNDTAQTTLPGIPDPTVQPWVVTYQYLRGEKILRAQCVVNASSGPNAQEQAIARLAPIYGTAYKILNIKPW